MKKTLCVLLSLSLALGIGTTGYAGQEELSSGEGIAEELSDDEGAAIAVPLEESQEEIPLEALSEDILAEEELQGEVPAEEIPVSTAFPAVGDVIYGFEAVEEREFPLLDADIMRFVHQKTGAELFYIANDDINRVFDLVFFTDPIDNTGLPHVFEHSTLDGSQKYPSKSLFFNLSYQTYQTYMNANTNTRLTTYPVGSLSEAQLLKFADYYTDSCFYPSIMTDESIYREEAWRYRLDSADAPLSIEGTVYSEMLGAMSLNRWASLNFERLLFPGSTIGNESGGLPEAIPDMTFDMLRNYHDTYYHPSNCAAYLYGSFENYTAFLSLLDGTFSQFERKEFAHQDPGYAPITAPVKEEYPFPVEAGSSTTHASTAYYGIVCPGAKASRETALILNTLTDLLYDDASLLQQNLKEAIPYGQFQCYYESQGPEDAVVFTALNIDPADADTFKAIVDDTLKTLAETGFAQEHVDGVMTTLKIQSLTAREATGAEFVDSVLYYIPYSYANSGNCWDYLDYSEGLFHIDEWNQEGRYAKAIADHLVDSQTTALAVTYPQPGLKEEQDSALAARLAEVKAAMSEEEIAAIVSSSTAAEEPDDASQYVAALQAVTVDTLPEEAHIYDIIDEASADGIRHVDVPAGVDGIGYPTVFLDISDLEQEDILWTSLYVDLLTRLDTESHTRSELATLIGRYLNGFSKRISLLGTSDDFTPYLRASWIALDEDLSAGYDVLKEILFETSFGDAARVLENVQGIKATLKQTINQQPYNMQLYRALGKEAPKYNYFSYATYLPYYEFLVGVEELLGSDPDAAVAKLEHIKEMLNNRFGAISVYAGTEESIALNRECADAFFLSLAKNDEKVPVVYDLPVAAQREGIIVEGAIQFNLLAAAQSTLGIEEYDGAYSALSALVLDSLLYPQLRDQYGAYSVFHAIEDDLGMYLISYRDPNVAQTFDVYDSLYDQIASMPVSQETLNGYILSAYSSLALPAGELNGAVSAAFTYLSGNDQEEVFTWMRELKTMTPEKVEAYASLYQTLSETGVRSTAGPASAINANAELYDVILNPFAAVDTSTIAFEDAPEDHPQYEAIRFAFENGLMQPAAENVFGADAPATLGDALTAMYVLIGGEADTEAAVATFAQYGLVEAEADMQAPVGTEQIAGLLAALTGAPVEVSVETEAMSRGELAVTLMEFVNSLG